MRPRYGRRRLVVALVAIAVIGGTVWLVQATPSSPRSATSGAAGHRGRTHTAPPGTASTTSTTATSRPPLRDLAVALTEQQLADTGRPLVSNGVVLAPVRALPTYVWTPVAPGRYPLVVFVHGYDRGPLDYQRFCSTLASSGYVVAAPSFPLEDPSRGFGLDRSDLPNEAADVSSVITSMESQASTDRLEPARTGVVGHSDGADVALEIGYEQGTVDHRVQGVVAVAPDPVTSPLAPSTAPLLLVQGTVDSVVPYASSQSVFAQLPGPTYYVSLLGADHLPPIAGGTAWTPVLDAAVADFLDATVADRGPGVVALVGLLGSSPLVRLATRT
jgi:pimeloyl-ACP methyl ester carboxylesterase